MGERTAPAVKSAGRPRDAPPVSLGLAQLFFQSVAYMAPAVSVVFVTLVVYAAVGASTPLSFLVAGAACLCVAVCVGEFARAVPSAGGLSTYVSIGLGSRLGFIAGWMVLFFLLIAPGLMFLVLAFVVDDVILATYRGLAASGAPWWPWILGAATLTLVVNLRGATLSANVTGVLGMIEIVLIVVLAASIVGSAPGAASAMSFGPDEGGSGIPAILAGAAIAFLAFPGFDSAAYLAEDARRPRSTTPRAVILAAAAMTVLYVFCAGALVVGLADNPGGGGLDDGNAWLALAARIWGGASIIVLVALLSSALAAANAGVAASSRLIHALGRAGVLPRAFARIDQASGVPGLAVVAVVAVGAATALVSAQIWGLTTAIALAATVLATSALLAYLAVCPATIIYFATRDDVTFRLVRHGIVPAVGALLMTTTLAFQLANGSSYPASLGNGLVIGWAIVGIGLGFRVARS
jgi:amino acid transporter